MGYIEPGHGLKGKQWWLLVDDDLHEMYSGFTGKREILLRKQPKKQTETRKCVKKCHSNHTAQTNSKKGTLAMKITEVESIVDKFRKLHSNTYSVQQFNTGAHLIRVGKHSSIDVPHDLPYFRGCKNRKSDKDSRPTSLVVNVREGVDTESSTSSSSIITSLLARELASEVSALISWVNGIYCWKKGLYPKPNMTTCTKQS